MTTVLPGLPAEVDSTQVVRQMLRRAASPSFNTWWARAEAAGFCANPIHLTSTDKLGRKHEVFTRCNNRRAIVCPSCSDLYARDTWQLIHAGLHGGHHNVPATVAQHPQVFVTLTAPSFGAVHTIRANGSCSPRDASTGNCEHNRRVRCDSVHQTDDPALGQPLCRQCYDYVGHVLFSWHAPELWRRFTIRLRRLLRQQLRASGENPDATRISFVKVVELQRRGLPHFHAVIRLDAVSQPEEPPSAPNTKMTAYEFVSLVRQAAADTQLTAVGGRIIRFGDQLDVKPLGRPFASESPDSSVSSRHIARYLAKYITKSVADFGIGIRKFSHELIDQLDITDHVRELLNTIVALGKKDGYHELLSWVHNLGYRGHVMSKSRRFSTTMTALRERRASWRKDSAQRDTSSATDGDDLNAPHQWEFERVGHISLGDRVLVISAFDRAREQRFTARDAIPEGP
jgi:hypothetical protein